VRHDLALAGLGVVVGLVAAAALTRLMRTLLYGITPLDPVTYPAVPVVLVADTVLASYVLARRAASVDPVESLSTLSDSTPVRSTNSRNRIFLLATNVYPESPWVTSIVFPKPSECRPDDAILISEPESIGFGPDGYDKHDRRLHLARRTLCSALLQAHTPDCPDDRRHGRGRSAS